MTSAPPPPPPKHGGTDNDDHFASAKAFFEAAKRPEVRAGAMAAAKNPFVRNMAVSAAKNEETRNAIASAISKPPPNVKRTNQDDAPPPPPPHRNTTASAAPAVTAPKPRPPSPSVLSYGAAPPPKPAAALPIHSSHSAIVNQLQGLHINTQQQYNRGTTVDKPLRPPPPNTTAPTLPSIHIQPTTPTNNYQPSVSHEPHAIVRYPFTASQFDELTSSQGDTILLKREIDDQWIYGMNTRTGSHGIIPMDFLDIRIPLVPIQHSSSSLSSSNTPHRATALYDYSSNTPGDLQFRVHDVITVLERVSPEWYRGRLHGQEGIFPSNFVDCPTLQHSSSAPSFPSSSSSRGGSEFMTASYEYNSGVPGDLHFVAGDKVEILDKIDSQWIRGRVHGREGLAPLTFLSPVGSPSKSPKSPGLAAIAAIGYSTKTVTAIDDYSSDLGGHLFFSRGDKIIVLEDVDETYYKGRLEEFKTLPPGIFPKNMVR